MPEFEVRIEQEFTGVVKFLNHKEMKLTALSGLDAHIWVLRDVDTIRKMEDKDSEWDDFDVTAIVCSAPTTPVAIFCRPRDGSDLQRLLDDEVGQLLDGRIDLETVKDQLSPANYEWVKKDIEFRKGVGLLQGEGNAEQGLHD